MSYQIQLMNLGGIGETGAICLINEIFLECHYNRWQRCCPGKRSPKYQKTYSQCLELFSSLRKCGVLVIAQDLELTECSFEIMEMLCNPEKKIGNHFHSNLIMNSNFWFQRDSLSAPISSVIYSCDGLLIFIGFCDGALRPSISDSSIRPTAYISTSISSNNSTFQVVIAAHPSDPYQFVLGMSDGAIHVIKSSEAETKRGGSTSQDNGVLPSITLSSYMNSLPSETPS
ncbi:hypothetical protein ACS0TY_017631 [Phlomoides rotata]